MSGIICHVSNVIRHVSRVYYIFLFIFYKVMELVNRGSVINRAYPVWLSIWQKLSFSQKAAYRTNKPMKKIMVDLPYSKNLEVKTQLHFKSNNIKLYSCYIVKNKNANSHNSDSNCKRDIIQCFWHYSLIQNNNFRIL